MTIRRDDYAMELKILKYIAIKNGYNPNIIDKLISKKQNRLISSSAYITNHKMDASSNWITLPYIHGISNIVQNFFHNQLKEYNIKTITVNKVNLGRLLINNRNTREKHKKSGVYEIKCSSCDVKYIGQTGRAFETRIKEHSTAIRLRQLGASAFSDHCLENGHQFDGSFRILHSLSKGKRLNLLEALEIWKASKSSTVCNDQQDILRSPLLGLTFKIH